MKIQMWDADRVIPYENNVKKHPPEQVQRIVKSMTLTGKVVIDQPIVVDKDGVIIKGHGRRLAMLSLGLKKLPVLVRDDMTEDEVKAARIADNRVAISDVDTDMLRDELASLVSTIDLSGIFDVSEITFSTVDLGEINPGAFVGDLNAAVDAQDADTRERMEKAKDRRVPLAKVFGFKDISGATEKLVTRFLAYIEAETGLVGEAALATYASTVVGSAQ